MFDHSDRAILLLLVGLASVTLGSLMLAAGLFRARVAPRWVPIALLVGTVAFAAAPFSIAWWASLPATVAAVAIGWYAWRPPAVRAPQ